MNIKNTTKHFGRMLLAASAIALSALAFAPQAEAQTINTLIGGGTNCVNATVASNYTVMAVSACTVSVPRSRFVTFAANFKLNGAGTSAVTYSIDTSVDNTVWETNHWQFSVTAAGTAWRGYHTNLDMGGAAYFRLGSVTNANATDLTNHTVKASFKPGI